MSIRFILVCPADRQLSIAQELSNNDENKPKIFKITNTIPPRDIIAKGENRFFFVGKSGIAKWFNSGSGNAAGSITSTIKLDV